MKPIKLKTNKKTKNYYLDENIKVKLLTQLPKN